MSDEALSFSHAELEFKLVYVGDAKEDKQDQVLDVVVIDAVAPGTYKFVFEVGHGTRCATLVVHNERRLSP